MYMYKLKLSTIHMNAYIASGRKKKNCYFWTVCSILDFYLVVTHKQKKSISSVNSKSYPKIVTKKNISCPAIFKYQRNDRYPKALLAKRIYVFLQLISKKIVIKGIVSKSNIWFPAMIHASKKTVILTFFPQESYTLHLDSVQEDMLKDSKCYKENGNQTKSWKAMNFLMPSNWILNLKESLILGKVKELVIPQAE